MSAGLRGEDDTIFALSSGAPPAAISIVRISGPKAGAVIEALAGKLPPPRYATLAALRDGEGLLLDRALVLWFPAPGSATGEDVAELHLHGGKATIAAVYNHIGKITEVRLARSGEFTRRAMFNGKIDFQVAEGLADLLAAETEQQRRWALRTVEGGLGRQVAWWREELLMLAARVEASIEFAEDEDDVLPDSSLHADVEELVRKIEALLAQPPAERLKDGPRVVVAGPVNAGKSSLVNALAEREVAIATPIAGTTRDIIEVPLKLGDQACLLIDTAGLRETEDVVEKAGINRAHAALDEADLLLWLGDPVDDPAPDRSLHIHAQADRIGRSVAPAGSLSVSVKTGEGLETLTTLLQQRLNSIAPPPDALIVNQRQRVALMAAAGELRIDNGSADDLVMLAERLRAAHVQLGEVAGSMGAEDVLDRVFSRFCIGK